MKLSGLFKSPQCLLLGALLISGAASGCQTTINGQTLPSATYLRDDVQFFPAGPEEKLYKMKRALSEYDAISAGIEVEQDFGGGLQPPPPPPAP